MKDASLPQELPIHGGDSAIARRRPRVVVATVPSDCHMWNLVYLHLVLEEAGYEVINLGHCTPTDDLVTAVRDKQPEAVVVSSVNGHGAIEGRELIERLRAEPAAAGVVAIIGGKLGITGAAGPEHAMLLDAGFDAVIEAGETHDPAASMPQHLPQLEQAR